MSNTLYYLIITIIWIVVAGGLFGIGAFVYNTVRNRSKTKKLLEQKNILLQIDVPKDNEKTPLAAEQMFASIHGIFRNADELKRSNLIQEHMSFEISSKDKNIRFFAYVPETLKSFIESQIYAQYPSVSISNVDDYTQNINLQNQHFAAAEIELNKEAYYPIKTFPNFEVDPLAAITSALTEITTDEQCWIQIAIRPIDDSWSRKGISYIDAVRGGKVGAPGIGKMLASGTLDFGKDLIKTVMNPEYQKEMAESADVKPEIPPTVDEALKGIETKATKLGYEASMRLMVWADDTEKAKAKLHNLAGVFKQFNTTNQNGFIVKNIVLDNPDFLETYQARLLDSKPYVLNIEELASIFHLPSISVETPNIVWAGSKKGEPPVNLPTQGSVSDEELTTFAKTDFRNAVQEFGIKNDDRHRHIYTIGKTGTGKSTMLENMAIDDIKEGRGIAFIDPHGDPVERIMQFIPPERHNDVVIFDPSDANFPIGFNLLENINPEMKTLVVSGLVGIFQKIWAFTWGPRLEHILRNAIMALMDYPNATLIDVLRILSDKEFRHSVINHIKDPVIKEFWTKEFEQYNDRLRSEAIAPIQNKVGQFVSSPIIRNIIGQPTSTINIDDIINSGKILLVNISKGKIGEDNSALLGAMLITKIQLAAMNRAYMPESERKDFYLYVDEFQNFATESFATIFSEARKYKLSIIVANQYIAQMPEEVRDAVFGNVGTIISFRVGAQDSPFLAKEMAPVFEETDFVNLDKYRVYVKMSIDGVTSPAFSAITLPPAENPTADRASLLRLSRLKYSKPIDEVEKTIEESLDITRSQSATGEEQKEFIEEKKKKGKGPSGVIKVKGDRWYEYIDKDGKRWYQKEMDSAPQYHQPSAELRGKQTGAEIKEDAVQSDAEKKIEPGRVYQDFKKEEAISPVLISDQTSDQNITDDSAAQRHSINTPALDDQKAQDEINLPSVNEKTKMNLPSTFYRPEEDKVETQYPKTDSSESDDNTPTIIEPGKPIRIDEDK